MLIKDIISAIEKIAPLCCQAEWDKSGLQVAGSSASADKIAVFLDPTPENLEKALASGAEFLLSHHPLSLKPGLPNRHDNWFYALKMLLGSGAPLYAAHTSLDVNLDGPAGWFATALELQNVVPIEPVSCLPGMKAGYGGIGKLPEEIDLALLLKKIMSLCKCGDARLCGKKISEPVKVVAWCGGSGASLLKHVQSMAAGLFVTGDVKYHDALEAEIAVLDVGHFSMEEIMMAKFAEVLQKLLPGADVFFMPSKSPFTSVFNKE